MAGGRHVFVAETLTAANWNQYIASQMVMRFDTKAEMLAALPARDVGTMAFYNDYEELVMWNGTAWKGVKPRTRWQKSYQVNNTTTYADTDITFELEASSDYVMKAWLSYKSDISNDIKFRWSYSGTISGNSGVWGIVFNPPGCTTQTDSGKTVQAWSMTSIDAVFGGVGDDSLTAIARGKVDTTTGGTLTLQFARNSSTTGGDCTFSLGSVCYMLKVK